MYHEFNRYKFYNRQSNRITFLHLREKDAKHLESK